MVLETLLGGESLFLFGVRSIRCWKGGGGWGGGRSNKQKLRPRFKNEDIFHQESQIFHENNVFLARPLLEYGHIIRSKSHFVLKNSCFFEKCMLSKRKKTPAAIGRS